MSIRDAIQAPVTWTINQYQQAKDQYEKLIPFPHSMIVTAIAGRALSFVAKAGSSYLLSSPNHPCSQQETLACLGLRKLPQALETTTNLFLALTILNSLGHIYIEKQREQRNPATTEPPHNKPSEPLHND